MPYHLDQHIGDPVGIVAAEPEIQTCGWIFVRGPMPSQPLVLLKLFERRSSLRIVTAFCLTTDRCAPLTRSNLESDKGTVLSTVLSGSGWLSAGDATEWFSFISLENRAAAGWPKPRN